MLGPAWLMEGRFDLRRVMRDCWGSLSCIAAHGRAYGRLADAAVGIIITTPFPHISHAFRGAV